MRVKKGFKLRSVGRENVVIATGSDNIDFSKIISLNDTAAKLWREIEQIEFSSSDLEGLLLKWYEIDEDTVKKDVDSLVQSWIEIGIVE